MPLGWLETSSAVQFPRTLDGISMVQWSHFIGLHFLQSLTTLPFSLEQSFLVICSHLPLMQQLIFFSSLAIAKGAATMKAIIVNNKKNFFIRRLPKPKEILPPPHTEDIWGGESTYPRPLHLPVARVFFGGREFSLDEKMIPRRWSESFEILGCTLWQGQINYF
jgi:hypothetical protein